MLSPAKDRPERSLLPEFDHARIPYDRSHFRRRP